MRIYEYSLFYNENRLATLKLREGERWIDEIHFSEANRTFRGAPKDYTFAVNHPRAVHHKFDAGTHFVPPFRWGLSRRFPFYRRRDMARKNETIQRDHVHDVLQPNDDDIVILSDLDEIIDSRHAEYLVDMARRHGVITVALHHTMFFLNLFSLNWHELWKNAPADYAYRTFVMTGAYFRKMTTTADRLRRLGEWGRLTKKITSVGFRGFHHSWLGDAKMALDKLTAYAHGISDHSQRILDPRTGAPSLEKVKSLIESGESIFPSHQLAVRGLQDLPFLRAIEENLDEYRDLILVK